VQFQANLSSYRLAKQRAFQAHCPKATALGGGSLLEATMGFEPMMRVLQTLALPLGDVAVKNRLLTDDQRWQLF
jgi:hypothetical protein